MLPFNFLIASHGCDFVVEEVRDFHSADSMELGVFANPNDKIVLEVAFPRWICVNYLTKGEGWGKSGHLKTPTLLATFFILITCENSPKSSPQNMTLTLSPFVDLAT